jgi:hypothetical protein
MGVLPTVSRTDIRKVLGGMPGVRLTEICSANRFGKRAGDRDRTT